MDEFNSNLDKKEEINGQPAAEPEQTVTSGTESFAQKTADTGNVPNPEEPYVQRPSQKYGRTAYQQQMENNLDMRGPNPYVYEGYRMGQSYRSEAYRNLYREDGYDHSGMLYKDDVYRKPDGSFGYGRPDQEQNGPQGGDPYCQPNQPYGNGSNGQPNQPYGNGSNGQPNQPYGNGSYGQPNQLYGNGSNGQGYNQPYANDPYRQPWPYGNYGQPNQPYANPPYGRPAEKQKEPVSSVFAYILMALVAVSVIIGIFNYLAVFDVMKKVPSFDYATIFRILQNDPGYTGLALISQCVTIVTIIFLVLDIVKIYRANYKVTGLILFAIFLRPAYFIWRAYLLGKKKAFPIVFTVAAYGIPFIMVFYFSYHMVMEIMYTMP